MNGFVLTLGLGLLAVLLPAVGVAWWEHRKRSAATRTRRREAGGSRREVSPKVESGTVREVAAVDTPAVRSAPAVAVGATPVATAQMAKLAAAPSVPALAAAPQAPIAGRTDPAPQPAARERFDGPGWAETAPMTGMGTEPSFAETMPAELQHFAETMPAELPLDEPSARPGQRRQPA